MVEYRQTREQTLDAVFHALAHPIRRSILNKLKRRGQQVTELADDFDVSLNAVSKHLKVLESAQLIKRRVDGRVHLCSFNAERLKEIDRWLEQYRQFWTQRLDALENFVLSSDDKSTKE